MINNFNILNGLVALFVFAIDRDGRVDGTRLPHVRGIPQSKASLYKPERDFQCLDGSRIINFNRVNDDYCDCGDGSDEPGTSACPNGYFFCQNAGHVSQYLPSSRVNDGYCDCCDASDEWNSDRQCRDICEELGKEARKEAEMVAELAKAGNKIRLEMIAAGKKLKTLNLANLVQARADYDEALLTKKEKEETKKIAEERESVELEKYKPAEPEITTEDISVEAKEYFAMLDSDNNGVVNLDELKTRATFDKDRNGEITDEEALYFLNNKQEMNSEEFVDVAWPIVKPFVMKEQGAFEPPRQEADKEIVEEHEGAPNVPTEEEIETEGEDEPHEEEEEEEATDEEEEEREHEQEQEQEKEPEVRYSEETQALIDEANQARGRYRDAEKACHDLQDTIRKLDEKIARDYGPDEEFSSLDGECFEYRDLEYVYSMCPFGRASQRSVSGGSDVNLGHFQEWAGTETNKYTKMKFDRGLTCWNGPARNTLVNLRCGTENRLVSVSEPNRCEYVMEFTTPALCNPDNDKREIHDEL